PLSLSSFLLLLLPPSSTLFPYTTLFRSEFHQRHLGIAVAQLPRLTRARVLGQYEPCWNGKIMSLHALAVHGYGTHPAYPEVAQRDRKSTRLNSSHVKISYAVFCLKKKTN